MAIFNSHVSLPVCSNSQTAYQTTLAFRFPRNNDPVVHPIDRSFRLLWHGVVDESVLFVDPRLVHGFVMLKVGRIYGNLWESMGIFDDWNVTES